MSFPTVFFAVHRDHDSWRVRYGRATHARRAPRGGLASRWQIAAEPMFPGSTAAGGDILSIIFVARPASARGRIVAAGPGPGVGRDAPRHRAPKASIFAGSTGTEDLRVFRRATPPRKGLRRKKGKTNCFIVHYSQGLSSCCCKVWRPGHSRKMRSFYVSGSHRQSGRARA